MFRRPTAVPVEMFEPRSGRWAATPAAGAGTRERLSVATYNIWFNDKHAEQRYRAIADILSRHRPDVMTFQEVTPTSLAVFLEQPWIREQYACTAMVGDRAGNYGMLMLSRVPIDRVTYTKLPTRLSRGYLTAELTINGHPLSIVSIHLESGKAASHLRTRQLRRVFESQRTSENAIIMGDFNMRDSENNLIDDGYQDIWPALRPHEPGFTEDTSINLMRFDMKNKDRHVRFDRVLTKGDYWVPETIELLGREPISNVQPRVFPSDHFGVICELVRSRR
jgi:tyrosyl-DNA phosphodiesterase 2